MKFLSRDWTDKSTRGDFFTEEAVETERIQWI
jgi:hypothetical protein